MPKRGDRRRAPFAAEQRQIKTLCARMKETCKRGEEHKRLVWRYDVFATVKSPLKHRAKERALASRDKRIREEIAFLELCKSMPRSLADVWPKVDISKEAGKFSYFARNSLVNTHDNPGRVDWLRTLL